MDVTKMATYARARVWNKEIGKCGTYLMRRVLLMCVFSTVLSGCTHSLDSAEITRLQVADVVRAQRERLHAKRAALVEEIERRKAGVEQRYRMWRSDMCGEAPPMGPTSCEADPHGIENAERDYAILCMASAIRARQKPQMSLRECDRAIRVCEAALEVVGRTTEPASAGEAICAAWLKEHGDKVSNRNVQEAFRNLRAYGRKIVDVQGTVPERWSWAVVCGVLPDMCHVQTKEEEREKRELVLRCREELRRASHMSARAEVAVMKWEAAARRGDKVQAVWKLESARRTWYDWLSRHSVLERSIPAIEDAADAEEAGEAVITIICESYSMSGGPAYGTPEAVEDAMLGGFEYLSLDDVMSGGRWRWDRVRRLLPLGSTAEQHGRASDGVPGVE